MPLFVSCRFFMRASTANLLCRRVSLFFCRIVGRRRLLLGLEVVEEDAALLGLLAPVLDDDARAVDDLAGVALAVDLACFARQSEFGSQW